MAALSSSLRMLQDWIFTADPGLMRLVMASRGTASVLLTTLVAVAVGHLTGISPIEFASGIALSLMGPFLMREPTRRQRQRTLIVLLVPAALSTVGTALLHGHGPVGDSCFLGLVFLCFLLHPRNPRMIGIGLVAVVTAYVGLYLELPPSTLPQQLASLVVAIPIVSFACFVLIPMRPAATLRRTVQAVQSRAAQVLHIARQIRDTTGAATSGESTTMRHLHRSLARLNEAALTADDQLALMQPEGSHALRTGLINIELATSRLIEALKTEKPGPRHATRLLLHARRMRRGARYIVPSAQLPQGSLLAELVELGHIAHGLGVAARTLVPAREAPAAAGLPPGRLAWRMATRVTLAAGLAMAGGMALSPQRWFWAVITVYVVFLGARSRGDTIHKGAQRLGGTLLGIASGLVLATLLAGNGSLEGAALLLAIFGMYYFFLVSYTVGIFCVTVMLGLLYGMLGASLETLLVLRLEETAIGTAAAVFVATFVLPTRTRDQVLRSGRGVLAALVEAVRASRHVLSGQTGASPVAMMRKVDRQVADLRLALAPLTAGRTLLRRTALERPVPALLDCVRWARVFAAESEGAASTEQAGALACHAAAIESRLAALARVPTNADQATSPAAEAEPNAHPVPSVLGLDQLDRAVSVLAERLKIGAVEGFALED